MKPGKLILFSSLLALGLLAWWLPRSDWLGGRLRAPIESGLGQATGREVHIGGVGAGFSGWVWLHDVSLGPDPLARPLDVSLTAKALGLRLDLWSLLKGRADLSSLKMVKVREPKLFLIGGPQAPSRPAGSDAGPAWDSLPLPPVSVELGEGEAWYQAQGQPARRLAEALRLDLEPGETGGYSGRLRARPDGGGSATLWFKRAPGDADLELRLRADELGLAALLGRFLHGQKLGRGSLSGELEARAKPGQPLKAWPVQGKGKVKDLAWSMEGRPELLKDVDGRWSLDGGILKLDGLQGSLAGSGFRADLVLDLLRSTLQGKASTIGTQLKSLSEAVGQGGLELEGQADLDLTVAGPLSATALSAHLRSRAALWQGRELNSADLSLQWGQELGSLSGRLGWNGGHGNVDAHWQGKRLVSAVVDAKAVPAPWLQSWLSGPWEGTVDLVASYKGESQPWDLSLRADQVRWKEQVLRGLELTANGGKRSAKLRLGADWERWQRLRAVADADRDSAGRWTVKRARITQGDKLLAQGQGFWSPQAAGAQEQARFSASLSALPLAPLLAGSAWQGLSGTAQGDAEAVLKQGAWSGTARLEAFGLKAKGADLSASASLRFEPQSLSVSSFSLRGDEFRGSAWAPAVKGPWTVTARLKKASLPALAQMLSGEAQGLSGSASGSLDWKGADGRGQAELSLEDPLPLWLPGAVSALKLGFDKDAVELEALSLEQGKGSLKAQGRWDLSGKSLGHGTAQWQGLSVRGLPFQGQAVLESRALNIGPWSLSGTALAPLSLQLKAPRKLGLSWGRIQAEGSWGEGAWALHAVDELAPGSALAAQGRAGAWQAELKGWDLARLAHGLEQAGSKLPGLKGALNASLSQSAGTVGVQARVAQLGIDGTELGPLALQSQWRDGKLFIEDLRLGAEDSHLVLKQGLWQPQAQGWQASGRVDLHGLEIGPTTLAFQGSLTVTARKQQWNGQGQFDSLVLGRRAFQGLGLEFNYEQEHWSLRESGKSPSFKAEGHSSKGVFSMKSLQSSSGKGQGSLRGSVGPEGRLDFDGSVTAYPVADLAQAMGWEQDWSGLAFGTLKVSGTVEKPLTTVSVKAEDGSVQGLPFDLATAVVQADDAWADLSPIHPIRMSRRNGVSLEVGGKVPLATDTVKEPDGLLVWAELKQGGLGLLSGFGPVRSGEGPLELKLQFSGRRSDPQVRGILKVSGGKLVPAWLLPPLDNVDIFARLEDGHVLLDQAQARIAGGGPLLKLELAEEQRPAFVLDHWLPAEFNLRLRSSKSGLPAKSTPELRFMEGTLHPDLRLLGSWDEPRLEGTVSVEKGLADKAVVLWPPQWNPPLASNGKSFADRVVYALKITGRQDVMVRTEAAQVFVDTGETGLVLSGGGEDLVAHGRIKARQGSVDYLLTSFQLDQEKETFIDLRGADPPLLELWGIKRMRGVTVEGDPLPRDVEVRLHAFGELGQVQMQLESPDAQLRQDQLASLVGLGADTSDPRNQGGFARLLGKVPAGLLTRFARRSGLVDEVGVRLPGVENALTRAQATPGPGEAATDPRLEPTPVSGTGKSLVEVNVGKYVGERVYLGVNTAAIERVGTGGKTSVEPAVGGKVEVELKDRTRFSAQHNVDPSGRTEQKVMLETSNRFENYNPRKRRWSELSPTPTRTPVPRAKP